MELYNEQFKYHCNHCEFRALEEEFLNEHIEAFHQSKFSCRKCLKMFSQEDELRRHITDCHEETCYQCSECEYKAPKKDILKRHIKIYHRKSQENSFNADSIHEGVKYFCDI